MSQAPYSVSSVFGNDVVRRQRTVGADCAMAGAAMAVEAMPAPATLRSFLRFSSVSLLDA
jgi:hypothetical protein